MNQATHDRNWERNFYSNMHETHPEQYEEALASNNGEHYPVLTRETQEEPVVAQLPEGVIVLTEEAA